eukprot:2971380-Heterocapsa_arctica.AAC.1
MDTQPIGDDQLDTQPMSDSEGAAQQEWGAGTSAESTSAGRPHPPDESDEQDEQDEELDTQPITVLRSSPTIG